MYYYLNLKMNKGVGYMPTQEELADFNYIDKYFKDDLGSEYIEEQPYFWFINEAFLKD